MLMLIFLPEGHGRSISARLSTATCAFINPRYANVASSHELARQIEGWIYVELPTGQRRANRPRSVSAQHQDHF